VTRNNSNNKKSNSGIKKAKRDSVQATDSERPTLADLAVIPASPEGDASLETLSNTQVDGPSLLAEAPEAERPSVIDEASEAETRVPPDDSPERTSDALPEQEPEVEQARELSQAHLRGLLEALVFASDKPMKHNELARLASAPVKQVKELLGELRASYATRGIVLDEIAGGWLFRTNAQYAPFVRELAGGRPVRLSRAQIETLAIAAYRQPITRPEIDEIRGVDSGATLKLLLERDLVRILGKKDEPGRPLLYGTTTHFLEFFNMKSLKDLPTLREFTELSDESLRIAEAELEGGSGPPTIRAARMDDASNEGQPEIPAADPVAQVPFGVEDEATRDDTNRSTLTGSAPAFDEGER
jgi:segregation and condensation protein B